MWKLLFFFFINGQLNLGLLDVNDLEDCKAKAAEMMQIAEKKQIPLAVKCVQIKIA